MDTQTPKEPKSAKPHGTRTRYFYWRCRCDKCRKANARYQRTRRRVGPQLVAARKARTHIRKLRDAGYGTRLIADLAGVDRRTIQSIADRKRKYIFLVTQIAILAVAPEAVRPGSHVDAGPTMQLLAELRKLGFTKKSLARHLGSTAKVPALQLNTPLITERNAAKVRQLHQRVMTCLESRQARLLRQPRRQEDKEGNNTQCSSRSLPTTAISELTAKFLFRPPRANGRTNASTC